jgi:hypothetical protein
MKKKFTIALIVSYPVDNKLNLLTFNKGNCYLSAYASIKALAKKKTKVT